MSIIIRDVQNPAQVIQGDTIVADAFDTNPTTGETIVVFVYSVAELASDSVHLAPTDSYGNTYVQAGTTAKQTDGSGNHLYASLWYSVNITGGAAFVVTGHQTPGSVGFGNYTLNIHAWALSPCTYNNDFGKTQTANGVSNTLSVTTVGTVLSGSMFFAAFLNNDGGVNTGAGYNTTGVNGFTPTMAARLPDSTIYLSEYKVSLLTTALTLTATDWAGVMGAYAAVAGSFASVPPSWFYNPATEHYKYDTNPGSPWVANDPIQTVAVTKVPDTITDNVETPLLDPATAETAAVDLFTPGIGCSSGGTSVAITGTGFGDGATVTFGGVAATDVEVVNHKLILATTPAHADGAVDVVITQADSTTITGTGAFTYGTPWWQRLIIVVIDREIFTFEVYVQSCTPPDTGIWVLMSLDTPDFTWWRNVDFGFNVYQVDSPGTGWVDDGVTATPASNNGWYESPVAFGGSVGIVSAGRPKDPRTWANIATWATANTGMLGGAPAASVIFENHLIYPSNDYTVGTTYPPIRVFDGSFDHELCKLPPTTLNVVPKAVMAMLPANGQIYLSSFDSGTSSADWRGRVFSLDLNSGVLTPLGTQFAAGEMPYALCWHMGRLWCGTNNGIGTVGKVYYYRPGIDTTWTLDYSLATSSVGGVDSMCSYKGKLYVGSDGAAGTFSKILVRDSAGAYTTSHTASGGTARLNNGHIAMVQFGDNLYASYWNNDTTAVSLLKKFDNSSWSTVYTPTTTNIRPYIVLFEDDGNLFAVGGGHSLTGALVRSANGTSWTSLTSLIPETSKTLLPIYGVEIL